MASILDLVPCEDIRHFAAGDLIIEQGKRTRLLWFLVEGAVEVIKDGVSVATATRAGAVFGEMSVLLGVDHTATVRALCPCTFRVVADPDLFLESSPPMCMHICQLLARRLDAVNQYLVDLKQQFVGNDHLGIVDEVLKTLMHRHPSPRVRPRLQELPDNSDDGSTAS